MPIEVKCPGDARNRCVGRNGEFQICSVVVDENPGGGFSVKGVSKRLHRNLSGGFVLDAEVLDRLATQWLESRGKINASAKVLHSIDKKLDEIREILNDAL